MTKIQDVVFAITDTETTGRDPEDRAIEIASVKWQAGKGFLEMPKSWLVNPHRLIHPSAMAVHHLTEEDIAGAPDLEVVQPEVIDYVKGTTLIAHNASFDMGMLPFLPEPEFPWLDSLRIARHVWKKGALNADGHDLNSHTCQELRYWLKLKVDTMGLPAHRAAADILVAGEVFGAAVKLYMELSGNDSYEDFVEFAKAPVLVEKMGFSKYKGELLTNVPTDFYGWLLNKVHDQEMSIDDDLLFSVNYTLKARGVNPHDLIKTKDTAAKSWNDVAKAKNSIQSKFIKR